MAQNIGTVRLLSAFLTAPLMTPISFFIQSRLSQTKIEYGGELLILIFETYFAYIAALTLGVVLFLILHKLNKPYAILYVIGGAMIGIIMYLVVFRYPTLTALFKFAIPGALSSLVFWGIAYRFRTNSV